MRNYIPVIVLILFLTGCREKEKTEMDMDPDIFNGSQVSLMVKGKRVFTFDEGTGQLGYNGTLRQFRAGNDDMTSFFVLTCGELPRTEGQEVRVTLQWTSGSAVKTSTGLNLKVMKYDNTGLVWLWNSADKTGAVVKTIPN